jgi:hypothetical protein
LKKLVAGISVLVAIFAANTVAAAGPVPDPEYGGRIDDNPDRYIGFDVKGSGGDRVIKNTFIENIPFHGCNDPSDNGPDSGDLDKKVEVKKNGSFDGKHSYDFGITRGGGATGLTYWLKGELDKDLAVGTIRIKLHGTGCDSGERPFKAPKPAKPQPLNPRQG